MKILRHLPKKADLPEPCVSANAATGLLMRSATQEVPALLKQFHSSERGLTASEAKKRLRKYGRNIVVKEQKPHWIIKLLKNFKDPLSLLLVVLAVISYVTHDLKATIIISAMVLLSIFLRFFQELKADKAAEDLRAMVHIKTKVSRHGAIKKISLENLVPGDIVHLSAGDMVPADLRIISAKDLFVNQATLTGEAMPVEKNAAAQKIGKNILDTDNLCFLGNNIESGTATAIVLMTGKSTYLGCLAESLIKTEPPTSFDVGVKNFTWLIMKMIFIMVPAVFLINGIGKGDWFEAFLFSMAVAVGLAPEMLPMIVTVNLSKGAMEMSKKKVIVKHLDAIQNFGAMNILCTDKTGTLTQGKVILEKYLDILGNENQNVLNYAFLNSYYQTGLTNLLDAAVLKHQEVKKELKVEKEFKKVDEIPFDFTRRRMSVVVENGEGKKILICKGAIEEVVALCDEAEINGKLETLDRLHHEHRHTIEKELNSEGFRVVAVAYREFPSEGREFSIKDESRMKLLGFLAFLDPPKESAAKSITELEKYGIEVKILTGDNEIVTKKICGDVGLPVEKIITGEELDGMNEADFKKTVEKYAVFAKLDPMHKEKIISMLRQYGNAVGFLGDGINDAPALRAADVGISVDTAADIAKESSDIILLEKSLLVLKDGVVGGRKIFGNVTKYIEMSASSNFGNMFSVVGASLFLPFLPMLPIQILVNNLLYDISQTSIPADNVDPEYLLKPRRWDVKRLKNFILCIGPISSLYDFATYFVMLYVFNAWFSPAIFHTGWFVESLISQTLIIHIIRTNKIPFIQSRASWPITLSTLAVVAIGIYLPFSPLAGPLGFVPLPPLYWLILFGMIITYFVLTQLVKLWFIKRFHAD